MTPILSETRERLLRTIIAQVPPERIAEIHFFAPIKQGGVESGVAVVAAIPESPVVEAAATDVTEEGAVEQWDSEETPEEAAEAEQPVEEAASGSVEAVSDETAEAPVDAAAGDEDVGTPDAAPANAPEKRHVIYTARYRYTLKGPDRGKWETNVKAEADAPLITVETVVRGVQRRVGDVEEPGRMTGDDIRAITGAWA